MERIIVYEITFFYSINVFDVIRMLIIVIDVVRVCIMTYNKLIKFYWIFYSDSEAFLDYVNLI